jgi:tRNA(Ile)-lysidine synthase
MGGRLDPAVAATRRAVRAALADVGPGQRIVVACSGGADSMALAAAAAFESRAAAWIVSVLIVDHGLQPDSSEVASTVAARLSADSRFAFVEAIEVVRVQVGRDGGPEAAARTARYAALAASADQLHAIVLLGHTRDDQAETVLLGLARGSGLRSLAGMRPVSGRYRRPFLGLTRAQTQRACQALELPVWHDPANADAAYTRVRVRRTVLPLLETELGPGVAAALARTAEQAAIDADALDALAETLWERTVGAPYDEPISESSPRGLVPRPGSSVVLRVDVLVDAPAALRRRVLRKAAVLAGCPGGDLFAVHVAAVDALLVNWHGQRAVDLPGRVTATRRGDALRLTVASAD